MAHYRVQNNCKIIYTLTQKQRNISKFSFSIQNDRITQLRNVNTSKRLREEKEKGKIRNAFVKLILLIVIRVQSVKMNKTGEVYYGFSD